MTKTVKQAERQTDRKAEEKGSPGYVNRISRRLTNLLYACNDILFVTQWQRKGDT